MINGEKERKKNDCSVLSKLIEQNILRIMNHHNTLTITKVHVDYINYMIHIIFFY